MNNYIWLTGREEDIYDVRNSFLNYVRREKKKAGRDFDPEEFFQKWKPEIIEMWSSLKLAKVKKIISVRINSGKHGSKWDNKNYNKNW
ncbi:MAG: hypothetical protein ACP5EQ_07755 [Candidatus Cloacimonadia bacterium]